MRLFRYPALAALLPLLAWQEALVEKPAPEPFQSYTDSIPGSTARFEMIAIAGGRFTMGSRPDEAGREENEVPSTDVDVAPFWIGKTEVTWDEFEAFYLSKETPSGPDAITRPSPFYFPHDRGFGRGRRPAIGLSFHAAETYCEWLTRKTGKRYRIPTEAEWEFACRRGSLGPESRPLADRAWHKENSEEKTHEVGATKPDVLGLHDMLGNAWEYCLDTRGPSKPGPILKGGSYLDPPSRLRPSTRQPILAKWNERDPQRPRSPWWVVDGPFLGFRIARSAPPPTESR
jgi:formylglycine-generating enzyme required for sulfatase activity